MPSEPLFNEREQKKAATNFDPLLSITKKMYVRMILNKQKHVHRVDQLFCS